MQVDECTGTRLKQNGGNECNLHMPLSSTTITMKILINTAKNGIQ